VSEGTDGLIDSGAALVVGRGFAGFDACGGGSRWGIWWLLERRSLTGNSISRMWEFITSWRLMSSNMEARSLMVTGLGAMIVVSVGL